MQGAPNLDLISTSYAERQNLTIRMSQRRFTRLTNAFSKKLANHVHSFSMWSLWYNFGRVHQSLKRQTPAMAAGVARQRWTAREVIDLIDERRRNPAQPPATHRRSIVRHLRSLFGPHSADRRGTPNSPSAIDHLRRHPIERTPKPGPRGPYGPRTKNRNST